MYIPGLLHSSDATVPHAPPDPDPSFAAKRTSSSFTSYQSSLRLRASVAIEFVFPLFSYSYELLFPQALYFDNHPHCLGVWGSNSRTASVLSLCALCLCGKSIRFIRLRTLCRLEKSHLPWNQELPDSFAETPGVGGYPFTTKLVSRSHSP